MSLYSCERLRYFLAVRRVAKDSNYVRHFPLNKSIDYKKSRRAAHTGILL